MWCNVVMLVNFNRCHCQAALDASCCRICSLTLVTVCWWLLSTAAERAAVPQPRGKQVRHTHTHIKYSIFSVYWPSMYFALHTALPDSVLSPMCFSAQPASLRVSSVSVVRSDHSSICVSWRPVPAVSGYRVVIQALRGTSSEMNHHNASWTFFLCVEN